MIVNITAPDEGDILVMGQHVSPELQPRIGYLPEERGLYKKMKVGEQLVFFANLKGLDSARGRHSASTMARAARASEWKNKKPSDLSKGMQQKIQFIAAVIHEPDFLILDEPFSGSIRSASTCSRA